MFRFTAKCSVRIWPSSSRDTTSIVGGPVTTGLGVSIVTLGESVFVDSGCGASCFGPPHPSRQTPSNNHVLPSLIAFLYWSALGVTPLLPAAFLALGFGGAPFAEEFFGGLAGTLLVTAGAGGGAGASHSTLILPRGSAGF